MDTQQHDNQWYFEKAGVGNPAPVVSGGNQSQGNGSQNVGNGGVTSHTTPQPDFNADVASTFANTQAGDQLHLGNVDFTRTDTGFRGTVQTPNGPEVKDFTQENFNAGDLSTWAGGGEGGLGNAWDQKYGTSFYKATPTYGDGNLTPTQQYQQQGNFVNGGIVNNAVNNANLTPGQPGAGGMPSSPTFTGQGLPASESARRSTDFIPNEALLEHRASGLLDPNNPFNRSVVNSARQIGNSRGALNSTITGSLAQDAIIKNAINIAGPDAATYANAANMSQDLSNRSALSAQEATQTGGLEVNRGLIDSALQKSDYGFRSALQSQGAAENIDAMKVQGGIETSLANLNNAADLTKEQFAQNAATLRANAEIASREAINNAGLSADMQQKWLTYASTLGENYSNAITSIYNNSADYATDTDMQTAISTTALNYYDNMNLGAEAAGLELDWSGSSIYGLFADGVGPKDPHANNNDNKSGNSANRLLSGEVYGNDGAGGLYGALGEPSVSSTGLGAFVDENRISPADGQTLDKNGDVIDFGQTPGGGLPYGGKNQRERDLNLILWAISTPEYYKFGDASVFRDSVAYGGRNMTYSEFIDEFANPKLMKWQADYAR